MMDGPTRCSPQEALSKNPPSTSRAKPVRDTISCGGYEAGSREEMESAQAGSNVVAWRHPAVVPPDRTYSVSY
jgi:hypothetical protein